MWRLKVSTFASTSCKLHVYNDTYRNMPARASHIHHLHAYQLQTNQTTISNHQLPTMQLPYTHRLDTSRDFHLKLDWQEKVTEAIKTPSELVFVSSSIGAQSTCCCCSYIVNNIYPDYGISIYFSFFSLWASFVNVYTKETIALQVATNEIFQLVFSDWHLQ